MSYSFSPPPKRVIKHYENPIKGKPAPDDFEEAGYGVRIFVFNLVVTGLIFFAVYYFFYKIRSTYHRYERLKVLSTKRKRVAYLQQQQTLQLELMQQQLQIASQAAGITTTFQPPALLNADPIKAIEHKPSLAVSASPADLDQDSDSDLDHEENKQTEGAVGKGQSQEGQQAQAEQSEEKLMESSESSESNESAGPRRRKTGKEHTSS
eukprot:TRINITY_DN3671_c0_g2_i1.p1 TRINITY_DN3671_c0_g2~~TRINITY_DN3671_c0_g2_i1.p1  ORF type:complete len:239 (-),score=72.74 TRINITY_DN3671_c0_g2_i1:205-828(-)